jgi:hypothetical protein
VAHACHPSKGRKPKIGGSRSPDQPDPHLQNARAKRTVGVPQVLEYCLVNADPLKKVPVIPLVEWVFP